MEKTNNRIENLLKSLGKLNEGTYTDVDTLVKKLNRKDGFRVDILINFNRYEISFSYGGEYTIIKKIDGFADIYRSRNFSGLINEFIHCDIDNHKYHIYNYGITKDEEKICKNKDNEMIKQLDENTYIGYNLKNKNAYVYLKKYDVLNKSHNINVDFIKYKYNDTFVDERDKFNKNLEESIEQFKDNMNNTIFKELANTININLLKYDLYPEIDSLKELGRIYNKYKINFNITTNEKDFNDIISYTNKLLDNPYDAKENSVKNLINNINLKDPNALKNLKEEIDSLIKYQKNYTKKKTK